MIKLIIYPIGSNLNDILILFPKYYLIKEIDNDTYDLIINRKNKIIFKSILDYNLARGIVSDYTNIPADVIILETWGYDSCQFSISRGIEAIYTLATYDYDVNIKLEVNEISPTKQILSRIEVENDSDKRKSYTTCIYVKEDENKDDDLIDINKRNINNYLKLSPKLKVLIENLKYGDKHIVFCRNKKKYGKKIIEKILKLSGYNVVYDLDEYNDCNRCIYVTNKCLSYREQCEDKNDNPCIVDIYIDNVDRVHVIDNYNICLICDLVSNLNQTSNDNVIIDIYSMLKTTDSVDSNEYVKKLQTINNNYEKIITHVEPWII